METTDDLGIETGVMPTRWILGFVALGLVPILDVCHRLVTERPLGSYDLFQLLCGAGMLFVAYVGFSGRHLDREQYREEVLNE